MQTTKQLAIFVRCFEVRSVSKLSNGIGTFAETISIVRLKLFRVDVVLWPIANCRRKKTHTHTEGMPRADRRIFNVGCAANG